MGPAKIPDRATIELGLGAIPEVTSQNIVAFEKHLATTPDPRTGKLRHPNTVIGYLSSFRGVFTIAVQQFLMDTNPMDNVAVGSKIDSKRQPYSVEQVSLILTRAQVETDDIFLPILVQAYTGCRVAETRRLQHPRFQFRAQWRCRESHTGAMVPVHR